MRWAVLLLAVLLLGLQYRLWLGEGGYEDLARLRKLHTGQSRENEALRARNRALAAEVEDLRAAKGAVEERARADLGMVKEGEVFIMLPPAPAPARPSPTLPNPAQHPRAGGPRPPALDVNSPP
jgi:cell division protein FtsB